MCLCLPHNKCIAQHCKLKEKVRPPANDFQGDGQLENLTIEGIVSIKNGKYVSVVVWHILMMIRLSGCIHK